MSSSHTTHCDMRDCGTSFTVPLPEADARRDAAERGWLQVYTETPAGPRRRDYCPPHARKILADQGL